MKRSQRIWSACLLLILILAACAPATENSTVTVTPVPPATSTVQGASADSPFLQVGQRYTDASEDMTVSVLDVVGFQATINEETQLLEVVLQLRDVPATITRRQMRNVAEYMWRVSVFLKPPLTDPAETPADYTLILWTLVTDPPSGQETLIPTPGEPETVPIEQLWDDQFLNDRQGDYIPGLDVVVDSEADTLTLQTYIPGISRETTFAFSTSYFDGSQDLPNNPLSPVTSDLPTPQPFANQASAPATAAPGGSDAFQLIPVGNVRAYPGPVHYAGDLLTFEVLTEGSFDERNEVTLQLDNDEPFTVMGNWNFFNALLLPSALDTTGLTGEHTLTLTTPDGQLNETYEFEVLPTEAWPAQELDASWQMQETACCSLHYVSNTAAARDIDFIAENFEQAAAEFAEITGEEIDTKLDVYIMDRMWGNGGFGGNGELVISYTDRYYGPTLGAEGLQTLARHEFTHAVGVGSGAGGYGVDFNSEGLAVFIAGGHYKPEPLAQRGAALYDLGYYEPGSQFFQQHELAYLYPATMLTYIVETYGMDTLWKFLVPEVEVAAEEFIPLESAIEFSMGISRQEFDADFGAWLEAQDPGEQLDDLRLTIRLQDLRRQYQDTYSPPPLFFLGSAADAVTRPEHLTAVLREARAPENVAIELLIANAQKAIIAGAYAESETLIASLEAVLTTQRFDDPLAHEYYAITFALAEAGYEAQALNIQGGTASVQVTNGNDTDLLTLELQKTNTAWEIMP